MIHVAWAAIAIAAFVLGNKLYPERRFPNMLETATKLAPSGATAGIKAEGEDTLAGRVSAHAKTEVLSPEVAKERTNVALSEANTITRRKKMLDVIVAITPQNWEEVLQEFVSQTISQGRKHEFEWKTMMSRIGEVDGARAIEMFRRNFEANLDSQELPCCLTGWAAKDAGAAQKWFTDFPEGPRKQLLSRNLVDGLTQSDPAGAIAFVGTLPLQKQGALAYALVDGTIQSGGISAAEEMFERVRDASPDQGADPLTATLFREVGERVFFSNWVAKTPEKACQWVAGHVGQPYLTPEIVAHAAKDYAILDAPAALSWVERNAGQFDERQVEAAIEGVVQHWTAAGFDKVGQWVEAHDGEPLRDQVAAAYVERMASRDLEAARLWSRTITSENARVKADEAIERAAAKLSSEATFQATPEP